MQDRFHVNKYGLTYLDLALAFECSSFSFFSHCVTRASAQPNSLLPKNIFDDKYFEIV